MVIDMSEKDPAHPRLEDEDIGDIEAADAVDASDPHSPNAEDVACPED